MKVDYSLSPCTKIKSKQNKDLNIRSETINYMEGITDTKIMDLGLRKHFMNLNPRQREERQK